LKKSSFTLIRPFQNGESMGFMVTSAKHLECRYLFHNSSCHTPSSFKSLKSHLLRRHLFFKSNTSIPSPPWSLGWQIMFHLASLYFLLCQSLCQKNHDLKKSSLLSTPTGISKKDIRIIGKLVRTELISISLSPYDNNFPIQLFNLTSKRSSTGFHSPFFSLRKWIRIPKYLNRKMPDSHPKMCLYSFSTSLASPKQYTSLLWKLIF
jgi:hypothetical protein